MSSEQLQPAAQDIPPELVGAYSTWKKKDGSGTDSNRHTYLIGEGGKKQVISREKFADRFESAAPSGGDVSTDEEVEATSREVEGGEGWASTWPNQTDNESAWWASTWPNQEPGGSDWERLPRDRGFEGAYDSPQFVTSSEEARGTIEGTTGDSDGVIGGSALENDDRPRVEYWSGNAIHSSDPNRIPYSPAELPEAAPNEKSRRLGKVGKLGKGALKLALGGALAAGVILGTGDKVEENNQNETPTDTTIELEVTPTVTPSVVDFEIAEPEPVAAPEAIEVTNPAVTPESTASATEAEQQPVDLTDSAPTTSADLDIIEPQSPAPEEAPEDVGDAATERISNEIPSEPEADPSDIESSVGASEALMISVEVEPGDGVTQVLARVLAEAGYPAVSPDQLFEIYEELVTDPSIGPDAIFEGVTLEYNQASGEYWIQGEVNVEASLTPAAAEWLQNLALRQ